MNKNRKILLISGVISCAFLGYLWFPHSKIVTKAQTIELGEPVLLTPDALLETKKMDKDVVKEIKIDSDLIHNNEKYTYDKESKEVISRDNSYLNVGTYKVYLTYKEEKKETEIKVKDTTSPEFIGFKDTITVEQNAKGFDLSSYYLAKDKSEVHMKTKDKTDISKTNKLTNTIIVEDAFENKTERKCKIQIVTQEDIQNGAKLTPMVDGNVPLSEDTMKKVKAGEIEVLVENQNEEIKTSYKDIREKQISGQYSYQETKHPDQYYNDDRFRNEGNISMESLGMDYKEYREFINTHFIDPQTGTMKGTYNAKTNAFEWKDEIGEHQVSVDGVGIRPEDVGNIHFQQAPSNTNQNNENSEQPGNPASFHQDKTQVRPSSIPNHVEVLFPGHTVWQTYTTVVGNDGRFFNSMEEAGAQAEADLMDRLLVGEQNQGGFALESIYHNGNVYYQIIWK